MTARSEFDQPNQIEAQICRIEDALRAMNLYTNTPPKPSAFKSSTPFCYDTMSVLEWLQWVMIPKMRTLLMNHSALPTVCDIHPLAEEEFKLIDQPTDSLLAEILVLDQLFNIEH